MRPKTTTTQQELKTTSYKWRLSNVKLTKQNKQQTNNNNAMRFLSKEPLMFDVWWCLLGLDALKTGRPRNNNWKPHHTNGDFPTSNWQNKTNNKQTTTMPSVSYRKSLWCLMFDDVCWGWMPLRPGALFTNGGDGDQPPSWAPHCCAKSGVSWPTVRDMR